MCGIIGYIGNENAKDIVLDCLKKLEYRGYDSSGISLLVNKQIITIKAIGKINELENKIKNEQIHSHLGIGHTRWATHGVVSLENAHPHNSSDCKISLVHNGIIENYLELKEKLLSKNVSFYGKTDTEVVVKYLEFIHKENPLESIYELSKILRGSFALSIIFSSFPDKIFFIKRNSPLLISIGNGANYLSSDYHSIKNYSNKVIYLNDNEYGYISSNEYAVFYKNKKQNKNIESIKDNQSVKDNSTSSSFLEKEIYETSNVISNILKRHIKNNDINFSSYSLNCLLKYITNINILGCGSSYNAGLIGKYIFEKLALTPTNVYIASEYKYNNPIIFPNSLNILISQSGETADLLSCISSLNYHKLGIINVRNSSLSKKTDDNFYLDAGEEISVATTKAYIGQLTFLYLLGIKLAYTKNTISKKEYRKYIKELENIPYKIDLILSNHTEIKNLAKELTNYNNVFFIGRGIDYLTCIEGSLKLKEITYIHSEAISSGELKHGTISLIDENVYVISLLSSSIKEKTKSNIEEVKSRKGKVFTISNENSSYQIPETLDIFYPFLEIIPLQLLSLYTGLEKKLDIDKPRNLAKSVTVE